MNSSDSSDNEDCLTSSLLSLNNDLNSSTLSINEQENTLLNNYKYSNNIQENINITVDNFIKLTNDKQDIIILINNIKNDLYLLPEFMKYIKLCDHKLALNLMDNPGFCFEKIFDILFNKSDNIEDHNETIEKILEICPNYNKEYIFEILKSNNFILDDTINYLFS
tara:strand:+ start:1804 stop:2301 length:498 start_codon:yes stop_codon:yes gene_type:complete